MDWEIIGRISDILGIISVAVSFVLWIITLAGFKKLKEDLLKQELKYAERREIILSELKTCYYSIYKDNLKNDNMIGELRQQILNIKDRFDKLLKKDKLKAINEIIKITDSDILGINFPNLQRKIDIIISAFEK